MAQISAFMGLVYTWNIFIFPAVLLILTSCVILIFLFIVSNFGAIFVLIWSRMLVYNVYTRWFSEYIWFKYKELFHFLCLNIGFQIR